MCEEAQKQGKPHFFFIGWSSLQDDLEKIVLGVDCAFGLPVPQLSLGLEKDRIKITKQGLAYV